MAQDEAHAGAGHPDLVDWHRERLAASKERAILRLMGYRHKASYVRMPKQPDVRYD